jgi:hypothetical protein
VTDDEIGGGAGDMGERDGGVEEDRTEDPKTARDASVRGDACRMGMVQQLVAAVSLQLCFAPSTMVHGAADKSRAACVNIEMTQIMFLSGK